MYGLDAHKIYDIYICIYNYYAQRPLLTYKHYWLLLAAGCCSAAPVVIVGCCSVFNVS